MRDIRPSEVTARAIMNKLSNASDVGSDGRLFLGVIGQHVRDYCATMSPRLVKAKERGKLEKSHKELLRLARDAESFFSSDAFQWYCTWIGLDADYARKIIFKIKRAQVEEFGVKEVAA